MLPVILSSLLVGASGFNGRTRLQQQGGTCEFSSPEYSLKWSVQGADVRFDLDTAMGGDGWSGVGFGDEMNDGDFIIIRVEGGQASFGDYFSDATIKPQLDDTAGGQSSVSGTSAVVANGRLVASFSRPLDTGDAKDKSLASCIEFMFPTTGGPMQNGDIAIHSLSPKPPISDSKICAALCGGAALPPGGLTGTIGAPDPNIGVEDRNRAVFPNGTVILFPNTPVQPAPGPVNQGQLPQIDPNTGLPFVSAPLQPNPLPQPPINVQPAPVTSAPFIPQPPVIQPSQPITAPVLGGQGGGSVQARLPCAAPSDAGICQQWITRYQQGDFARWATANRASESEKSKQLCRSMRSAQGPSLTQNCCNLFNQLCANVPL